MIYEPHTPDEIPFQTAAEARDFLAVEINRMLKMQAGKGAPNARTRLNALSKALDAWQKLYKLDLDTDEVRRLAEDIEELKRSIKNGPIGTVENGR